MKKYNTNEQQSISRICWRIKEIPGITGLNYRYVHQLVRSGQLKSAKINGIRIILDSDLRAFLGADQRGGNVNA